MSELTNAISILHVDDEPDFAELVAIYLQRQDDRFEIESATSASDGLDRLHDTEFDCIISDYDMPRLNGLEFLESVRDDYPDLPFILFTGKGSEEVASDAITAGATDYLQKGTGTDRYELLANRLRNAVTQYRATREAGKTQRRLQELAESSTDCLWMFDRDWEELLFISGYEAVWNRPSEAIEDNPQDFLDGVDLDHRDRVERAMNRLSTGEPIDIEYKIRRDDDDPGWVWVKGQPIFNDDGNVVRVVGFTREVTERKEYQHELEAMSRRLEAILDNTTTPMFMKDDEGRYIFANQGYRDLFGLEDVDIVGRTDSDIHPPAMAEQVQQNDQRVLDSGDPIETEERIVVDGSERVFLSTKVPIYDTGDRVDPERPVAVFGVASDITELKAQKQRLHETTSRLEVLFDKSPDMIHVLDPEGALRDVNRRFSEELGYDEDEVLGRPIWEIDQLADADDVNRLLSDFAPDERRKFEGVYERRDGSTFPVEVHLLRLDIEGENRFLAISREIIERKRNEQTITALHDATQDIFRAEGTQEVADIVVEAAHDVLGMSINGVAIYDKSEEVLRTIASTDEGEEIVGGTPVFRPDESLAWEAFESGESKFYGDVSREPGRANPETPIRSEMIVPLDEHGVILIGSIEVDVFGDMDISLVETLAAYAETALDRIDREQALEQSEARYRSLTDDVLDTSTVGTFILNADFEIQWINTATEAYFGIDRTEVIGADKRKLIHDHIKHTVEDSAEFASTVLATYDDNTYAEEFECHVLPDEGREERWLKHWSQPIVSGLYEGGRIEHYTDITERKGREQELTQQKERLDEFTSVVSHDLQNPLSVAEGRLELARDEFDSEHLDAIGRAHDRMNTLIDDLLTLARQGDAVGEPEPIDLVGLIENCWLNVDTEKAMLEIDIGRRIQADKSRLQQLLENLMQNAVYHGADDVTVMIGELDDGFYIEDDGPGIPEDERDDIFDAGYSTAENGTGFGLSIVKQVAEAHDWTVRVTEGVTGGARFEITGIVVAE